MLIIPPITREELVERIKKHTSEIWIDKKTISIDEAATSPEYINNKEIQFYFGEELKQYELETIREYLLSGNCSVEEIYFCYETEYTSSPLRVMFKDTPYGYYLTPPCTFSVVDNKLIVVTPLNREKIKLMCKEYKEVLDKETHHNHELVEVDGIIRWKEEKALSNVNMNEATLLLISLGYDKNSEIYRELYRKAGISLSKYWEIFYTEANNEDYLNYEIFK